MKRAIPVYDLTISDSQAPEFLADSVLVHNCSWVPDFDRDSPDRVDALVHAWAMLNREAVRLVPSSYRPDGTGPQTRLRIGSPAGGLPESVVVLPSRVPRGVTTTQHNRSGILPSPGHGDPDDPELPRRVALRVPTL